jgi:hypothetical protein
MRGRRPRRALVVAVDWASVVVYALVVVVALGPELPQDVGLGLRALEAAGILVATLLLLGITLAGALFVTTGPQAESTSERRSRVG